MCVWGGGRESGVCVSVCVERVVCVCGKSGVCVGAGEREWCVCVCVWRERERVVCIHV